MTSAPVELVGERAGQRAEHQRRQQLRRDDAAEREALRLVAAGELGGQRGQGQQAQPVAGRRDRARPATAGGTRGSPARCARGATSGRRAEARRRCSVAARGGACDRGALGGSGSAAIAILLTSSGGRSDTRVVAVPPCLRTRGSARLSSVLIGAFAKWALSRRAARPPGRRTMTANTARKNRRKACDPRRPCERRVRPRMAGSSSTIRGRVGSVRRNPHGGRGRRRLRGRIGSHRTAALVAGSAAGWPGPARTPGTA